MKQKLLSNLKFSTLTSKPSLILSLLVLTFIIVASSLFPDPILAQETRPRTVDPPVTNGETRPRITNPTPANAQPIPANNTGVPSGQPGNNRAAPSPAPQDSGEGLVRCGNRTDDPCTVEDIFNIFVIITNYLIGLAGVVAIISIVYAGFSMVLAAGRTETISAAKKRFTNSLIGLGLVMLAFLIINAVLYGTLGLGVFGGQNILDDPAGYINR